VFEFFPTPNNETPSFIDMNTPEWSLKDRENEVLYLPYQYFMMAGVRDEVDSNLKIASLVEVPY